MKWERFVPVHIRLVVALFGEEVACLHSCDWNARVQTCVLKASTLTWPSKAYNNISSVFRHCWFPRQPPRIKNSCFETLIVGKYGHHCDVACGCQRFRQRNTLRLIWQRRLVQIFSWIFFPHAPELKRQTTSLW